MKLEDEAKASAADSFVSKSPGPKSVPSSGGDALRSRMSRLSIRFIRTRSAGLRVTNRKSSVLSAIFAGLLVVVEASGAGGPYQFQAGGGHAVSVSIRGS